MSTTSRLPTETALEIIRFSTSPFAIVALLAAASAGLTYLLFVMTGSGKFALASIGCLCLSAILVPQLARKQFDPLEPIVLFTFSVLMGCTLRAVMLMFSDPENYRVATLTNGVPLETIAENTAWVPFSLFLLSFGYVSTSNRVAIERFRIFGSPTTWSSTRLRFTIVVLAGTSAFAIIHLINATGVDLTDLASVSRKRALAVTTDGGETVYAHLGYWLWLKDLSQIALLLLFTEFVCARSKRDTGTSSRRSMSIVGLVALTSLVVAWPLLSSSRSAIIQAVFCVTVISAYLGFRTNQRHRKRRFRNAVALGVAFSIVILTGIGAWRQYSQLGRFLDATPAQAVINNTVGSGNFISLPRTGLIALRAGERSEWLFGKSYLGVFTAPVPATIWPDKPPVSLGPYVRENYFGLTAYTNGMPPGFLGEAFMNFSYGGVIVLPFLAGMLLRIVYNSFRPLLGKHKGVTLIYASILWPMGFALAELNFSMVVVGAATACIPAFVLLPFLSPKQKLEPYSGQSSRRIDT